MYSASAATACWRCQERVGGPVCVGCAALQPAPTAPDFYALLGVARRYHLDLEAVDAKYRALARQLHPDRYVKKSAQERQSALLWTAHLNEARRVLRDPIRRARYLATGNPDMPESGGPRLDPAFLEEIMEWREEAEGDPEAVRGKASACAAELEAELEAVLTAWEEGRGGLEVVGDRLARLRYVQGMR